MTLSVDTLIVVSLMMAVFAAVSTVGSSLFLGAGYERLRAGLEALGKQTAFFSDAIHRLDTRVETTEKQGRYFFETISSLEQKIAAPALSDAQPQPPVAEEETQLMVVSRDDALETGTENLLDWNKADKAEQIIYWH